MSVQARTRICIFIPTLDWIERFICANSIRATVAGAKGHPLKRIRVILAGMPTLMLDIIHHVVAAHPDMAIVEKVDAGELSAAVQRTRADVVVVGHDEKGERDRFLSLLLHRPQLRVLAIADDGKSACLYDLRPRRVRIGRISAGSLARAIRGYPPTSRAITTKRRLEVH
jgi:hypothetical protein